jgi:hypothetical protein
MGILIAGMSLAASAAAGPQLESVVSGCGTLNCSGMTIRGIHQAREPFVVQIYARAGECLRLDVSDQTDDLAMFVLGPTVDIGGSNDDRDGTDLRPLIVQDPMPATGWYTVVISIFETVATTARFELEYGRYLTGNINCQSGAATTQMLSPSSVNPAKASRPAALSTASGSEQE